MGTPVDDAALDTLFRTARSQNKWLNKPVSTEQLIAIFDLMKWGPTSANSFPARIVFVTSQESKKRLAAVVFEGNRPKVMTAPATRKHTSAPDENTLCSGACRLAPRFRRTIPLK